MNTPPVKPALDDFRPLAEQGNVVPVYAQLAADFETPLSAYVKISGEGEAFLFESAESAGDSGRYSILGSNPRAVIKAHDHNITFTEKGETRQWTAEKDILTELESLMARYQPASHGHAPPFYGGAVGYLSYDAVRQFEPSIAPASKDELGLPDALFIIADTLLIFDHLQRRLIVVANAFIDEFETADAAHADAVQRIQSMIEQLDEPLHIAPLNGLAEYATPQASSNTTQDEYESMVVKAKEYIAAGDAFQIVPSQRFETDYSGSPVDLYRALRHVNPSPYMFILQLEGFALVGSSPEVHVRAINGRIDIRPIAGTRWRGKTQEEDDALAADLLADQKECAEHLMLVDLARNDVGRISKHGSVVVDDFMIVERYSHVMHIVSNVHGELDDNHSAYDVLRATFPAGTVSGAPKIRAMQIINELEKSKRCSYSGAVGYFGWDGGHDSCITLRTCLLKDGKAYVQAGAGVVADSNPTYEYNETVNKSMAILRAIGLAKTIGE
ncbi:anthranilate synthase component I [Verrucomicrobiaceae bacterium N1E253]|uniref:Anthranilate synthase component 1 n=1 Tax=Oceaniferula marina TaxID=2748318 RepID=A0A851GIG4_9BACT|nr:anthranilate synthase component I [Oceaniferula marina]NWK57588.1 anthranilate synthase component I [Oceaniferula marina]